MILCVCCKNSSVLRSTLTGWEDVQGSVSCHFRPSFLIYGGIGYIWREVGFLKPALWFSYKGASVLSAIPFLHKLCDSQIIQFFQLLRAPEYFRWCWASYSFREGSSPFSQVPCCLPIPQLSRPRNTQVSWYAESGVYNHPGDFRIFFLILIHSE